MSEMRLLHEVPVGRVVVRFWAAGEITEHRYEVDYRGTYPKPITRRGRHRKGTKL